MHTPSPAMPVQTFNSPTNAHFKALPVSAAELLNKLKLLGTAPTPAHIVDSKTTLALLLVLQLL